MHIAGVKYGLKIQPRQYESESLDFDLVPGETPIDEVVDWVRGYAEAKLRGGQAPLAPPPSCVQTETSTRKTRGKETTTTRTTTPPVAKPATAQAEAKPAAAESPAEPPKKKRGRPKKTKVDWVVELRGITHEAQTLSEMHERLVKFAEKNVIDAVPSDKVNDAIVQLRQTFAKLNTAEHGADPETVNKVVPLCQGLAAKVAERLKTEAKNE